MSITRSSVEIQKVLLEFILSKPSLYTRVQNIFNADNFDKSLRRAAQYIQKHAQDFNTIPTLQQINSVNSTKFELIDNIQDGHEQWFLEEFEKFTRIEEMTHAILKSTDLLEAGDFTPIVKLIKDAMEISLTKDLGINYFENPKERLLRLKNSNGQVSTGWAEIDNLLFGGVNKSELNIFAGGPGSGKSLFLQNLAANWISTGLSGLYITLELSEDLVAMRLDSMITGIGSRDLFKKLDEVDLRVNMASKKSGCLKIKFLPSGSTINDIRAYIKELKIKENFKIDFMLVDYLDLLNPGSCKINQSDIFTKDKLVSEELRNLAIELNSLLASASQLNRSSFEEIEFNMGNIAGGISKANSADNLFGIFTSRIMKERGAIQLQFLKTRNSSGVGNKVDLDFNVDTLRITNSTHLTTNENPVITGSNIIAQIKNKNTTQEKSPTNKKVMLDELLGKLSTSE
jgi:archaellum biogenesis ATPase FlaH